MYAAFYLPTLLNQVVGNDNFGLCWPLWARKPFANLKLAQPDLAHTMEQNDPLAMATFVTPYLFPTPCPLPRSKPKCACRRHQWRRTKTQFFIFLSLLLHVGLESRMWMSNPAPSATLALGTKYKPPGLYSALSRCLGPKSIFK